MQRIFIKKCFLFTAENTCRLGGKRFADDEEVETEVRKLLRQQSKLLCCEFRRTGKAMGQVYQCWWRICREINVFFYRFEYHILIRFISICVLFTDSHSYNDCSINNTNTNVYYLGVLLLRKYVDVRT
jgi:hypothetical protein